MQMLCHYTRFLDSMQAWWTTTRLELDVGKALRPKGTRTLKQPKVRPYSLVLYQAKPNSDGTAGKVGSVPELKLKTRSGTSQALVDQHIQEKKVASIWLDCDYTAMWYLLYNSLLGSIPDLYIVWLESPTQSISTIPNTIHLFSPPHSKDV